MRNKNILATVFDPVQLDRIQGEKVGKETKHINLRKEFFVAPGFLEKNVITPKLTQSGWRPSCSSTESSKERANAQLPNLLQDSMSGTSCAASKYDLPLLSSHSVGWYTADRLSSKVMEFLNQN